MAALGSAKREWKFTKEEIRAKLDELGYNDIPDKALKEFSNDLHKLISSDKTKKDIHQRGDISPQSTTNYSPASTSSNQSVDVQNGNGNGKRVTNKASTSTVYSDDEYSFEQTPEHNRYALGDKENQNATSLRMTQKRKVLRRKNGKAHVFDESFSQEAVTDISDVEKRLQRLPVKEDINTTDSESIESEDLSEESSSVLQPWGRNRNVLPSFIRPRTSDPGTKGIRKTDPVSRYHQFKQEWSSNKVPGERTHKSLRWSTREKMLQYESFEKPRRSYVPNNYVAPTEKKRQALRWEVRSALENC
ncbi:hydrolethalus syndrome protein 1 homolog [Dendronephthya gigantea]|uniref:hydrolethalus syndrome protein 1 homolog n=1 Tax=Dendronephthya gigantea TaxID=151771 RepID=UPI00106D571F|nr:hydrolethalus syndrome protein 1 homolog [Dendronephthya gigantea]